MAKNTTKPAGATTAATPDEAEKKPEFIICDVCGHSNPEDAALCKMCSNYLEGVRR